ncbi:uncharacterized protein ACLA_015970 [Aspergillus clavatus NRRL 1]|uniref:Uncharacterized protein n=1 Tax=Aspergillus clavatus (strain ATCC 1007 / CBS 513.65 / DSM 816 / NCTC 3887 / NRRL 1 / QM 1276 / 107) TaxID=344612 RepID=A1CBN3_ASPCL|nr:uncharacterized protein ACLA_015970 [Aspergillus clavatus NRRL 1]EAW13151.1 conserved hypothetical protein [Aspergillus clavatus NRRL 1]
MDSHQPSTSYAHSMRGSRRIAGLMASIRSRRARHRKSLKHLSHESVQNETSASGYDTSPTMDHPRGGDSREGYFDSPHAFCLNQAEDEGAESRKVSDKSDKTLESLSSDHTVETVCRDPSKRTPTPITIVQREYVYENPFDEILESSRSGSCSNPFTDQSQHTTRSSRGSSSDYSISNAQVLQGLHVLKRPRDPMLGTHLDILGGLSRESSLPSSCFSEGSWADTFDRHKAAMAYNDLATEVGLERLSLGGSDGRGADDCNHAHPAGNNNCHSTEELPRRRDRIIRRIRTMRSTLHVKGQGVPPERTLRRMKTFANLPSRAYGMNLLSGRSLESLARLGGHSFLALPGDFAPAALKLPVCFVATATYLRSRGTHLWKSCGLVGSGGADEACANRSASGALIYNLFFEPGDVETATRMYDCFAAQVLSAEKEQDTIELTMRRQEMPSELAGILYANAPDKDARLTLSVGWTYRSLLAGLPGGILGSVALYRVLSSIYDQRFSKLQLKRTRSCLGGLSQTTYARIKAIGLAMVALTSPMQLELMCAVFGLCAVLLHETGRLTDSARHRLRMGQSPESRWGILSRLGQAFGPLLTDGELAEDGMQSAETMRAMTIRRQQVAMMLIANWRGVSRVLRVWENQVRGPARLTISWRSCGDESSSGERSSG